VSAQHRMSDEEARALFGPDAERMLYLMGEEQEGEPKLLADKRDQFAKALDRMHMDTSGFPTMRWPDLEEITGPMLPGQLWVVLARPENGKTTFCLNNGLKWVMQQPAHGFAYFGTEEGPDSQQLRFAAILTGNPPSEVVAGNYAAIGGAIAEREIEKALIEINRGRYADLVFFAEETRPSLKDVRRAADDAVRLGLPILVLDHFHRMAVPETSNHVATLTETVRQIKQLAVTTGLVILMAAQARRVDGLARFMPPNPESGKGTGGLEEEADVMLGLFRPIGRKNDVGEFKPLTKAEIGAFERGELNQADVLQPHTMGVKVLKHRRNGDYSGRVVKLHCERGLLASHTGRNP